MKKSSIIIWIAAFMLVVLLLIGFGIRDVNGQTVYPYQADRPGMALAMRNNLSVDISFGASYAEGFDI